MYGIGEYVSAAISPSIGYIVGISLHLPILLFYAIDLLLKGSFSFKVNWFYLVVVLMQITCVLALFVSWNNHIPSMNRIIFITKSIMVVIPFQAYVVVLLYNEKNLESFGKLTFLSFSILLAINVFGFYGLGLSNETHAIEGRITFPFIDGFYSGACLLAIINLMIMYYARRFLDEPLKLYPLIAYFLVNLVMLYFINSRLTLLIFIIVLCLFIFNIAQRVKGLYLLSVFVIPILLNVGLLIYKILSLPFFIFLMRRANLVDVTTFNGRSFLWQR
jgi:hypothetical protein